MLENYKEVYIEGSVWSDYSHLLGTSIHYLDPENNVLIGVVQSLSVGDIWEETIVTERGTFLDVYADIDGYLINVGSICLLGHGWTGELVYEVSCWIGEHGFTAVTTPISLGSLPDGCFKVIEGGE